MKLLNWVTKWKNNNRIGLILRKTTYFHSSESKELNCLKHIVIIAIVFLLGCTKSDKIDQRFIGNWRGNLIAIKEHRNNDYEGDDLRKLLETNIEVEHLFDSIKVSITDSKWKFDYGNDSTYTFDFMEFDKEKSKVMLSGEMELNMYGKIESHQIFESYELSLIHDILNIDWVYLPLPISLDTNTHTLGGDISYKRVYYELTQERTDEK